MMDPYYSGAASSSTPGPASASASAVNAAAARPQSQLQSQSIIVPACTAVLAAVHQASADVTNFVRRCRPARADLAPVTRELSELQMVLQLLGDCDAAPGLLPDELQSHLRPILANCAAVVQRISGVLVMQQQQQQQQRPGDSVAAPLHWTVTARDEVDELAGSLEAHRGVVGLVSDLAAVLVSRGAACGWGDEQQQQQQQIQVAVILEELRVLGSSIRISYSGAALARENFALQVHLGQIVAYAETLARTEVWEDAVRTLDEAQKTAATTTPGAASVRASIPATAPLRRRPSAAAAADDRDAYVPDTGLENLLHMGSPDKYDPNRPPSMFFSPNRTPEPGGGGGAPATGFIVMDGFINSDPSSYMGAPARFPAHEQIGAYDTRGAGLGDGPETDLRLVSEKALGRGYSAERIVTTAAATPSDLTPRASRVTRAPRPLTAGLEVVMPPEKEMATGEGNEAEVTEEALAFAQVPVHILGRLSVNLVGQLYSNNPGGSSDKTSFNQSLSTIKTEEEEDEDEDERDADGDGVASTSTSDTGSLRDGRLQFSQLGSPKLPPPMMNSHSWSTSQTPSGSQPRPSTESLFLTQSYPQETTDNDDAEDDSSVMRPRPPPPRPSRSSHDAESSSSSHLKPDSQVSSASVSRGGGHGRGVRQMQSTSTMNTETFRMQKPLPKAPIVYIPGYPGPFIKKKAVVVGNFSCGKTCLITYVSVMRESSILVFPLFHVFSR